MVSWDKRMLSSSGYWGFSQPEICFGDQSRISLLATMFRNFRLMERRQRLGRKADCQASPSDWLDTQGGHHDVRPPGSQSIPLALNIWQSHGSTHRKPAPERFPRAHAA